ncbi:MAG: amidase [Promethearchaeota archaeon]|jgi:Asp-tRNA(Asn)/Glu-tRNA(Gln) amidotransferase A subunit family amidase
MNKEEICYMSACDMLEKIKTQELTSLEITEVIIERIKKINPIFNAYCTPTFDLARNLAEEADRAVKKGEKLGLLHGIPTSIKDTKDTKGIRTTYGCKVFENHVPKKDAILVKRLKDEGIVILGKTNAPAFGYKGVTDNLIFGATRNPWNIKRTSGGSSGGAAAAVASGLGPLAQGSDGGGSIRIPSSLCGVFGIKPNYGRIPQEGLKSEGNLATLVQSGPIVRFVKDAALMLDALVGADDIDRHSLPKPNYSYLEKLNEDPEKYNIGYSLDLGFAKVVDSEVKNSVVNAVQKFERLDWTVEENKDLSLLTSSTNYYGKIIVENPHITLWRFWTSGFAYAFKQFVKDHEHDIDPDLAHTIKKGFKYSAEVMKTVEFQRELIYNSINKHFKVYDLLITPTLACPAFDINKQSPDEIDGIEIIPGEWTPFTFPFNMSGHPAATIPCGWSSDGLPIGMQIVGKRFDEVTVLQVSKAFEELAPWQDKKLQFN